MEVGASSVGKLIYVEKYWAFTNQNRDLNQRKIENHQPEIGINWQKSEFHHPLKIQ
jgi:hypothetical protein